MILNQILNLPHLQSRERFRDVEDPHTSSIVLAMLYFTEVIRAVTQTILGKTISTLDVYQHDLVFENLYFGNEAPLNNDL